MPDEQRIDDLLVAWEEFRLDGKDVSAEDLCTDDPDLVEPVRSRIAALREIYSALSSPTEADSDTVPDLPATDALPNVQDYECVEYLGRGGAGVVYKAWQPKLSRFVALKMIRDAGGATDDRLERFQAEARAAQLQHANIVRIHDVGDSDGRPWLALEFLNGGTLEQWVKGRPQDPRHAAALIRTLAHAAHYAHGRGIIHRDLKPSNILFEHDGGTTVVPGDDSGRQAHWSDLTPKIVDFGIARFLDQASPLTRTGDVMGTPAYMAPEQVDPRVGPVAAATDVHALGVMLYELLTGRPPFAAPGHMETLNQVRHREPVPPSQLQPGIPADLENICLKCLQKEPRLRYADAEALATDLENFLEARPVSARPLSRLQRLERWRRRNPVVALLAFCLSIAVLSGFSLVTWKWIEADSSRQLADANFRRIRDVVDEYLVVVSDDVLLNEPGMQPLRRRLLTSAQQYYDEFLQQHRDDDHLQQDLIQVRISLARIQRLLGDRAAAKIQLQHALTLSDAMAGSESTQPEIRNRIENDLAGILIEIGELEAAQAQLADALRGPSPKLPPAIFERSRSMYLDGVVRQKTGRTAAAKDSYRDAIDLIRSSGEVDRITGTQTQQLCRTLLALASVSLETRDHADARNAIDDAVRLAERLTRETPDVLEHQQTLCEALELRGRLLFQERSWEAASDTFAATAGILERLAKDNPRVVSLRHALCRQYINSGSARRSLRPPEALDEFQTAVRLGEQLLVDSPDTPLSANLLALALTNSGVLQAGLGNHSESRTSLEQSVGLLRGLVDAWPEVVEYRNRLVAASTLLAERYYETGLPEEGQLLLDEAVRHGRILLLQAPAVAESAATLARTLNLQGQVLCVQGDSQHGLPLLREAIDVLESVSSADEAATATFRIQLARYHIDNCMHLRYLNAGDSADLSWDAGRKLLNSLRIPVSADAGIRFAAARLRFSAAWLQQRRGQFDEAIRDYETVREELQELALQYPSMARYRNWLVRTDNNLGNCLRLTGDSKRAERMLRTSFESLQELTQSETAVESLRIAHARAALNLGTIVSGQGRDQEALDLFQQAIQVWEPMLAVRDLIEVRLGLAAAYGNSGNEYWKHRNAEAALPNYNEALRHLEHLLTREPDHYQAQQFSKINHWGRARALNKLQRYRDAANDWKMVLQAARSSEKLLFQMELGWSLAKAGDHSEATQIAEDLITAHADRPAILFNCARLFALSFAAVSQDDTIDLSDRETHQQEYERRCVDVLADVRDAGYFSEASDRVRQLTDNADFAGIAEQPGFTSLVDELSAESSGDADP